MTRKALLVCSPGGHLTQMLSLEECWRDLETTWATLPSPDVEHLLEGRTVAFCHGPTNRSVKALARNLVVAWRVIRLHRPDVILSTGAALAVPFFIVGRLLRCRTVYVESLTRINELSLAGRLAYPIASSFFVQWPAAAGSRRRAVHVGNLL